MGNANIKSIRHNKDLVKFINFQLPTYEVNTVKYSIQCSKAIFNTIDSEAKEKILIEFVSTPSAITYDELKSVIDCFLNRVF